MKLAIPINKKLFDIYLVFTREPFVRYFSKEIDNYSNGNGGLLGFISLDLTDSDYNVCVLSRDITKQYSAERIRVSISTIEEAREWIDKIMGDDTITFHDNSHKYFNIFADLKNKNKLHPNFIYLRDHFGFEAAKQTLSEISYHYKDIDGNFIEQLQSNNGFDSRIGNCICFVSLENNIFHLRELMRRQVRISICIPQQKGRSFLEVSVKAEYLAEWWYLHIYLL